MLNGLMNLLADCIKMMVHIVVCKAKNQQTVLPKNGAPFSIVLFPLLGVMV